MNLPIVLREEARAEFDEAFDFFDHQSPGSSAAFAGRVQQVFDLIMTNPEMFAVIFADVRKAIVRRSRYCIYYRADSTRVEVIAVFHSARDPGAPQDFGDAVGWQIAGSQIAIRDWEVSLRFAICLLRFHPSIRSKIQRYTPATRLFGEIGCDSPRLCHIAKSLPRKSAPKVRDDAKGKSAGGHWGLQSLGEPRPRLMGR